MKEVRLREWLSGVSARQKSWTIDSIAVVGGFLLYFGIIAVFGKWRPGLLDPIQWAVVCLPSLLVLRVCRLAPGAWTLPIWLGLGISVVVSLAILPMLSANDTVDAILLAATPLVILSLSTLIQRRLSRAG